MTKNEMLLNIAYDFLNGEVKSEVLSSYTLDIEKFYNCKYPDFNTDEEDQILYKKEKEWEKILKKVKDDMFELLKNKIKEESDGEKGLSEIERENKQTRISQIVAKNKEFIKIWEGMKEKKVRLITVDGRTFCGTLQLKVAGHSSIMHPAGLIVSDPETISHIRNFTTRNKEMWRSDSGKMLMIPIKDVQNIFLDESL